MLKRSLTLDLPKGQSAFLWGARKTGKSTYLESRFPDSLYIDFLNHTTFLQYSKHPSLLREMIQAKKDISCPIIVDEVQKIPEILDEIHWLIEHRKDISFILCGSSFRKLKHIGANLLGGRAWRQLFLPLCFPELPEFDVLKIFNRGLIPAHYLSESDPASSLEGYIVDYVIPEVQWESRIRNEVTPKNTTSR
jgi:predicted AAA+ superfamily ATPase